MRPVKTPLMPLSIAATEMCAPPERDASTEAPETIGPVGELVRRYTPYVWRVLRSLGVRDVDLEDVCQETFMVVHRRAHTFEARGSLRSWIYGVALRVASDYRNRAHRHREVLTSESALASTQPAQEQAAETRRAFELVDRLLSALNEEQRQVFVLYELEELGMREISEIVGCPLQTAYSRLHSARRAVREGAARLRQEEPLP